MRRISKKEIKEMDCFVCVDCGHMKNRKFINKVKGSSVLYCPYDKCPYKEKK